MRIHNLILLTIAAILIIGALQAEQTKSKEKKLSRTEAHQFFAVDLNNRVWELLGNSERTEAEDNEMMWAAYASLYHWSVIGQPINIQRGEWMVSHVNSVLGYPESAVRHAERCWELTEEQHLTDFDRGYALEALARAYACAGDKEKARKYYSEAVKVGSEIEREEDTKLFMSDLETGPWYGIIE